MDLGCLLFEHSFIKSFAMSKHFFLAFFLYFFFQLTPGQSQVNIGPMISAEWNLYNWYQRPSNHQFSIASGGNRSVGQVLNVLPSARLGIVFVFDAPNFYGNDFVLLLEGGISYTPFSFDLEERKGQGALSFPVILSTIIPIGSTAMTIGGGIQFSKTEFTQTTAKYQPLDNPFFMTYILELGLGSPNLAVPDYGFLFGYNFFARVGYGEHHAVTLDIGVRASIGVAIPTS